MEAGDPNAPSDREKVSGAQDELICRRRRERADDGVMSTEARVRGFRTKDEAMNLIIQAQVATPNPIAFRLREALPGCSIECLDERKPPMRIVPCAPDIRPYVNPAPDWRSLLTAISRGDRRGW